MKNTYRFSFVVSLLALLLTLQINARPLGPGKDCNSAIPIYSMDSFNLAITPGSAGFQPACFSFPFQQPVCFRFGTLDSGLLNWRATPSCGVHDSVEFDWAVYDVTGGCPGISVACNSNYAGRTSPEGMQGGPAAGCQNNALTFNTALEMCMGISVLPRHAYVIYIDQYTIGYTCSVNINFTGSTFVMDSIGITGIPEIAQQEAVSVKVFPNPFTETTHIAVHGVNESFSFELLDITGRTLKQIPSITASEFDIRRDNLTAGVYLYRVFIGANQLACGKLVVQD